MAVKVYDFSFHKKPQSTTSWLSTSLRHHSLTRWFSVGVLTARFKNSRMVNSLWTRWAIDRSLKGEKKKNETRKHHISILPFRPLLICFFRLLESAISLKAEAAELCTAPNKLQAYFKRKSNQSFSSACWTRKRLCSHHWAYFLASIAS